MTVVARDFCGGCDLDCEHRGVVYVGPDGWLDPAGHFYSIADLTHDEWAARVGSDAIAMERWGWARVVVCKAGRVHVRAARELSEEQRGWVERNTPPPTQTPAP